MTATGGTKSRPLLPRPADRKRRAWKGRRLGCRRASLLRSYCPPTRTAGAAASCWSIKTQSAAGQATLVSYFISTGAERVPSPPRHQTSLFSPVSSSEIVSYFLFPVAHPPPNCRPVQAFTGGICPVFAAAVGASAFVNRKHRAPASRYT